MSAYAEEMPQNWIAWGDRNLGIITSGVAYTYAREVFSHASFLKLGMAWPLPQRKVRQFAAGVERVIIIEELDPFLEEEVRLLGVDVSGGTAEADAAEVDDEAAGTADQMPAWLDIPLPGGPGPETADPDTTAPPTAASGNGAKPARENISIFQSRKLCFPR